MSEHVLMIVLLYVLSHTFVCGHSNALAPVANKEHVSFNTFFIPFIIYSILYFTLCS